jgi:hypothetical protein
MRISGRGAFAGAGIGAVARGAVILCNLPHESFVVLALPSATIGVLVGAIAGSLGKPVIGTVLGAVLSAGVFELFMLPCASLLATFSELTGKNAAGDFLQRTLVYALEMGLAGALAGGLGGLIGRSAQAVANTLPQNPPIDLPQ